MEASNSKIINIMKYLLTILAIFSLAFFASCGGETKAECCGDAEGCCSEDHNHSDDEGNASE